MLPQSKNTKPANIFGGLYCYYNVVILRLSSGSGE